MAGTRLFKIHKYLYTAPPGTSPGDFSWHMLLPPYPAAVLCLQLLTVSGHEVRAAQVMLVVKEGPGCLLADLNAGGNFKLNRHTSQNCHVAFCLFLARFANCSGSFAAIKSHSLIAHLLLADPAGMP